MAATPPLSIAEVERILRALAPIAQDRSAVLVGGQAVAFWARFLGILDARPALAPLLSKDIDFEGTGEAARRAADLLGGSVRIPSFDNHTPNTGVVVFVDGEGIDRKIDFLQAPLGLRSEDVLATAVAMVIEEIAGIGTVPLLVMHPERCMESCVYNVQILGRVDDVAIRKLSASILAARAWSRLLLGDESIPERQRVRAVLGLNERIFRKCHGDFRFRVLFAERGVDPFDAVLVDDDRLPERFRDRRYPQMAEQLAGRRRPADA
ncbi:MAG: hypothetical protein ACRDNS_15445 [Trebonia sp.]